MLTVAVFAAVAAGWVLLGRVCPCRHREWAYDRDQCLECGRSAEWLYWQP